MGKLKKVKMDPKAKARDFAPGSRRAGFSNPAPMGLGKKGGRDDSGQDFIKMQKLSGSER